ncbi:hypothetical protein AYO45_06960 [Gammaproteobacteria bacterium SCGC AG-212-F23]|nr:hypothetical protein AYO45_06960 [Gammaproteobacteria bacterium SCGC AG-212-F23]
MPTLALNYTQTPLPTNVYEFGLSPQDEATQLIEKAHQSGFSRVLIIAPQSNWGHGIAQNITEHWQAVGGRVVDTYYFSGNSNFSQDIAQLLHAKTDDLTHQQHRQDVDVIFLLAQPENARLIAPLLKYYGMTNTPIYSTSVIYSGMPSPNRDSELNGIAFIDAPLTLQKNNNRLYAVGRDAYYISQHLQRMNQLANFPVYGGTGALTMSSNRQIHRRLPWVTMHDGHP